MEGFETWEEVLAHVRAGRALYYQAPMDYSPARVVAVIRKDATLRVYPAWFRNGADPFTADEGHLKRFRKE